MKVLRIEQNSEEWREFRIGKITGSGAKSVKPLSRGSDRTPTGFWQLLAGRLAIRQDGEDPKDRGHRLENIALDEFSTAYGLKVEKEAGVWVSDKDENIMFSPDGAEPGDTPTYSAEVKCLSSDKHIKYMVKDIMAKKLKDYNPIYSIPDEQGAYYRDQAVQAFVVGDTIKTHHFIFYDDRMAYEQMKLYVISINREHVLDLIEKADQDQAETWLGVKKMISFLFRELGIK